MAYDDPGHLHLASADRQPDPRALFSEHQASGQPLLQKLDQIVTELGFREYTTLHGDTFNMVLFTLSLMIGTAALPHVIMRVFTVPRVADARWSAGWTLVFIALLYLTAPTTGAMARLNITERFWPNGTDAQAVSVETIESDPAYDWMTTWQQKVSRPGSHGAGHRHETRIRCRYTWLPSHGSCPPSIPMTRCPKRGWSGSRAPFGRCR